LFGIENKVFELKRNPAKYIYHSNHQNFSAVQYIDRITPLESIILKNKLLRYIYFLVVAPLVFGSITFFYWYYSRIWFAKDIAIEGIALITVFIFLLFGLISLILCGVYIHNQKHLWKKIIAPVLIILLTFPIIEIFSRVHTSLDQQAFVRVKNDVANTEVISIRSDHFEKNHFPETNDFILSYYPVYTYDWFQPYSGNMYSFEMAKLTIEIKMADDSTHFFDFPSQAKGYCGSVRISELIGRQEKK